ncbi:hypothetical protein GGR58DRAFT_331191 [Xylaria digitata]|nr:hypothetical protein GGR58DRAFT_331191 [Xylaria digitata]
MENCTIFDGGKYGINVTSQDDIETGILSKHRCFELINVYDAKGSLNFTNISFIDNIIIFDSPDLEILNFPELSGLGYFKADNVGSLIRISMPSLAQEVFVDGYWSIANTGFAITGAPVLREFDYGDLTELRLVTLINSGDLAFPGIESIYFLEADRNIRFPDLTTSISVAVSSTQLDVTSNQFPQLTTLSSLALEDSHGYISGGIVPFHPNVFNGSLSLRSLAFDPAPYALFPVSLDFEGTETVKLNTTVESNTNIDIYLGDLVTIGGNFSFINNTNCTLNLDKLSSVGDLIMMDNINTTIPSLPNLKAANNVHLRGYIDPTLGANLFPALNYASGTVTVEAWNSDFDCSKLASQYRDSVIHNLNCNGTDRSTTASPTGASPTTSAQGNPSHGLPDGAWAGISVGIGAIVLGSIIAAAWLFLHYRRRQDRTKEDKFVDSQPKEEIHPPDLSGLYEAVDSRIIREAPDGTVYEMAVPPAEKPDDHLKEMESAPGEMPGCLPKTRLGYESKDMTREGARKIPRSS